MIPNPRRGDPTTMHCCTGARSPATTTTTTARRSVLPAEIFPEKKPPSVFPHAPDTAPAAAEVGGGDLLTLLRGGKGGQLAFPPPPSVVPYSTERGWTKNRNVSLAVSKKSMLMFFLHFFFAHSSTFWCDGNKNYFPKQRA